MEIKAFIRQSLNDRRYFTWQTIPDAVLSSHGIIADEVRKQLTSAGFVDFGCLYPQSAKIKWDKYL